MENDASKHACAGGCDEPCEAACKEERRIQSQPRVRAQRPCTSRASPRTPPHSDPANGHTKGTVRANRERNADDGAVSKDGGGAHVSKLVRLASTEAGTGAMIVVEAAAAVVAPSPLAVGAVLLAAAWAAAPVVACASSSLQAVSCLGASALSFQLRWPAAAPAKPKPLPPLETGRRLAERECACQRP